MLIASTPNLRHQRVAIHDSMEKTKIIEIED